jgi:signal transduction histidine kinase
MHSAITLRSGSWSLRRTLLGILLSLTITVWGVSAVVVYLNADTESHELFDQSLAETGHLLLSLAEHEMQERGVHSAHRFADVSTRRDNTYLLFQIHDADGQLIYKNTGAPDQPFLALNSQPGYGWIQLQGQRWRSYVVWNDSHTLQMQVVEPDTHRRDITGRFTYQLLAFALAIAPLLVLGIWWTVNRVFNSLRHYAHQLTQRRPGDFSALSPQGAPAEILPLVAALNQLFVRVSQTREREQRFTADAAHELRTPLAAVKTSLQVWRRARNADERQEAETALSDSIERASRLVTQLLALSRSEPETSAVQALPRTDLSAWCRAQTAEWQHDIAQAGHTLTTDFQTVYTGMDAISMSMLMRNLIDNACRYTPAPGHLHLRCGEQQGQAVLEVSDSGPGIPAAQRSQVLERFVRLSDASIPGSGLGLSIVANIAQAHGASLHLLDGNDGQGLTVQLRFPLS